MYEKARMLTVKSRKEREREETGTVSVDNKDMFGSLIHSTYAL